MKETGYRSPIRIIRNLSTIAHNIDYGKSTLSDRVSTPRARWPAATWALFSSCSTAWTSSASAASPIKARPCVDYTADDGQTYQFNSRYARHVDFTYEVSRSSLRARALCCRTPPRAWEAQTVRPTP